MTLDGELTRALRDWSGSFPLSDMHDFLDRHIKRSSGLFTVLIYLVLTLDLTSSSIAVVSGSYALRAHS